MKLAPTLTAMIPAVAYVRMSTDRQDAKQRKEFLWSVTRTGIDARRPTRAG